jgi:hypothetical protein
MPVLSSDWSPFSETEFELETDSREFHPLPPVSEIEVCMRLFTREIARRISGDNLITMRLIASVAIA